MHTVAVGVAPFEHTSAGPTTSDPARWVAEVIAMRADAVVVAELAPPWSGRELAVRLSRAAPGLPIAGVIARGDVCAAVRWFQAGAAEVLEPPLALPSAPVITAGENPISRFLGWARRRLLHGQLIVYPDTPFEGRLKFLGGELTEAQLLSLPPAAVLTYLLDVGAAELRWEPALVPGAIRPQVLVVEDGVSIRGLLVKRLQCQGYEVSTAPDGVEALAAVARADFDLMLLDLHLPRLDGWSVLRTLQSDLRNRELPVVLYSAHDSDVDALKAARAGARAYLKKSGNGKDVLTAVELLTRPRRLALEALAAGQITAVEAPAVGLFWFLSVLSARAATGLLELEDELGRYEVRVEGGRVAMIVAQQGSLRVQGPMALDAIVTARGRGTFTPGAQTGGFADAPELAAVLQEAVSRRGESTRWALKELAARPERLVVHEELGALYGRSATVDELCVLNALRERRSLDELTAESHTGPSDVEDILQHLLWRGVVAAAIRGEP
jgi:DNA-binding response OmpR family regulator